MRDGCRLTRAATALCALVIGACLAGPALAQDAATSGAESVLLTVDQERLFLESAFGRASLDRERAATRALEDENKKIEAGLIAEEQDLTTRRAELPSAEFAELATEFDEKVERIRTEQDAKARDLSRSRDEDRQAFLRAVVPVLGDLLRDKGAVAMLDTSSVVLSLTAIDITDEAILRVDTLLAEDGGAPQSLPDGAPDSVPIDTPEDIPDNAP